MESCGKSRQNPKLKDFRIDVADRGINPIHQNCNPKDLQLDRVAPQLTQQNL
jgi:hypothetical protein